MASQSVPPVNRFKTVKEFYEFLESFPNDAQIDIQFDGYYKYIYYPNTIDKKKVELNDNPDFINLSDNNSLSLKIEITKLKGRLENVKQRNPRLPISVNDKLVETFNTAWIRTYYKYDSSVSDYCRSQAERQRKTFIKSIQGYPINIVEKTVRDLLPYHKGYDFYLVGENYYDFEDLVKEYHDLSKDKIDLLFKKNDIGDHVLYVCNTTHEILKNRFGLTMQEFADDIKKKALESATVTTTKS